MRIALGIEYDGTDFCGWQLQEGTRTVQGEVEKALSIVADHPVRVSCAGRTDAGVHALAQVVHFDSDALRTDRSWVLGTNSNLPRDINISWAQPVSEDFNARFSATARSYRYVIQNRFSRSALLRHRASWHHQPLDVMRMQEAAGFLLGKHDFTSFRALACQAKHAIREITQLEVSRAGEFVYIDVSANAFLHHMVRNIAGVLMAVGEGERDPQWVRDLLEVRDRTVGGVTAPAQGLYLVSVRYPDHFSIPNSAALPCFSG